MEYLPGSYESKLNTLFKPSTKTERNNTIFYPEGVKFPIFIPSTSVDENVVEIHPSSTPHPIFYPITSTSTPRTVTAFWETKPEKVITQRILSTTTSTPNYENIDVILDLDGNISDHSDYDIGHNTTPTSPPGFEKWFNKTLGNISSTVNEFLSNQSASSTSSSIIVNNDTMNIIPSTESSFDPFEIYNTTSSNASATMRPPIFNDSSPVASTELLITYGFFVIFLAILGLISNSATIHVLFKENINLHVRKHYTNMTILSLALVNLIASIFVGFGGGINVLSIGFNSISGTKVEAVLLANPVTTSVPISTTPTPTPFHISNNVDTANSSVIASLISVYANVTFADVASLIETKYDTNNWTNITQIFPSIKRKIKMHHEKNEDPAGFCRMQCFFSNMGSFVTIWTLAVITADKFFAHNWPVKYNEGMDAKKFAMLIVYIWLQGIVFSSLSIELWVRDKLLDKGVSSGLCHCSINWFSIPKTASIGVAFFKLISFMWLTIFPYSVIFTLNTILVYQLAFQMPSKTKVTTMSGDDLPDPSPGFNINPIRGFSFNRSESGPLNPVNRFFQSNPQQDKMIWRVMPPPLSPLRPESLNPNVNPQYGNPPLNELFSSTFAGSQIRRSRLWEIHRSSQTQQTVGAAEATTESVLFCYVAVIFAYIWLNTFPGCLSFLLFVMDGQEGTFFLVEMMAFLFKLIGFSVNALIYFWLRKDFHDAFSGLFRKLCACEIGQMMRAKTVPQGGSGGGGGIPGVVVGDDSY